VLEDIMILLVPELASYHGDHLMAPQS
jgi:hypothetical protein